MQQRLRCGRDDRKFKRDGGWIHKFQDPFNDMTEGKKTKKEEKWSIGNIKKKGLNC